MRKLAIISLFSTMAIGYANIVIAAPPKVGEFTLNEISGSGCSMTLSKSNSSNKNRFFFFNGITNNSMQMRINDKIIKFSRVM